MISLAVALVALTVACTALILTKQRNKKLDVFLSNNPGENLHKILKDHFKRQKELKQLGDELKAQHDVIEKLQQQSLQKMGLVRYNPHRNTGGDQSFSLCLLDNDNNGILLTAIHGRETTRVYSKTIKKQTSSHQLSREETAALESALGN